MRWQEQKDARIWIKWGTKGESFDPETNILVKKGEELLGRILNIRPPENEEESYRVELEIGEFDKSDKFVKNGNYVNFSCPTYLRSALGFNPDFRRKRIAEVGDIIRIQYDGQDTKHRNAHQFQVFFAE
jgi:hypothetical protein